MSIFKFKMTATGKRKDTGDEWSQKPGLKSNKKGPDGKIMSLPDDVSIWSGSVGIGFSPDIQFLKDNGISAMISEMNDEAPLNKLAESLEQSGAIQFPFAVQSNLLPPDDPAVKAEGE